MSVNSQTWVPKWQENTSEHFKLSGIFLQPPTGTKVSVHKKKGHGQFRVLEQPSQNNGWQLTTVVEYPDGGASEYDLSISW